MYQKVNFLAPYVHLMDWKMIFRKKKYSPFERNNTDFREKAKHLFEIFSSEEYDGAMKGLNKSYCFKDIKNISSEKKRK
ncbi:hypothetical protein AYY16_06170 [Morganella psychrotolerans]|nr:hypothetical protein AYY16_06170 [Morganella psychrotolerans]